MLWRHYGGEQVYKTSTGDISKLFVFLCTKSKVFWTWWLCMEATDGSFSLLHPVVSAGTTSLEAVLWGWLPFSPESFWLVSSWWLQAVCFSPPCIVLSSISVFLMPPFSGSLFSSCLWHNFFFFTQLLILSHVLLLKGTEHCLFMCWLPLAAWRNSSAAVLGLLHSRAVPGVRCCLSWLVYVHTGTASRAVHKPRVARVGPLCQRHCVLAASSPLVECGAVMNWS